MMNKFLIGLNILLLAGVGYLFYKINNLESPEKENSTIANDFKKEIKSESMVEQKGNAPTGKIAYVNIDKLNDESLEIKDITTELKRRKMSIESSLETLNMEYQKKVEEYQTSAKAGIAPESELTSKVKYIESLEKQAQNKQLQMDDLSSDIAQKNEAFQQNVRNFLVNWNNGRYDYILSYSDAIPTILLGNTSLEVTNEVVAELNALYKKAQTKK